MTSILLQRFANREYRLTHQDIFVRKPCGKDKYKEVQAERYANAVNDSYVLSQELIQGESALLSDGHLRRREFGEVDARLGIRALDIIHEFQTKEKNKVKGGWGRLSKPTKFTKNARHRLLEAGAVVDAACGLNAWEITCTIPGSGNEVFRAVAAHTGWIMNELTQIIRRAKCKYWFYVWEYQNRGALHLHMLVSDPERDLSELSKNLESRWWALLQLLSQKLNLDVFRKSSKVTWKLMPSRWQSHVAQIKKSVAAYFSKYAGKGYGAGQKKKGFGMVGTPSRWWGSSQQVKKDITAARLKLKWQISPSCAKEVKLLLQEFLNSQKKIKDYEYHFELGTTYNGTNLGWGDVSINYYADLEFSRMKLLEEYYVLQVNEILLKHGYEVPNTDSWTEQDKACPTPLDAGITEYKNKLRSLEVPTVTPHLTPLTRHPSLASKLSKSRVYSSVASLELRALAVQYLAGGAGESQPEDLEFQPCQLELGLTNLLTPY